MSNYIETSCKAFPASGALGQYLRVKLSGSPGQLALAGAGDIEIGTLETAAFTAGLLYNVRLRSAQGTTPMVASGAITQYAAVYGDVSGQCSATPNENFLGYALNAASGAGSIVEVLRVDTQVSAAGQAVVEAHAANYIVTVADSGKTFSNTGAAAEVDFTLPASAVGLEYSFVLTVAQLVKILPNGNDQIGTASTATVPATGVLNTAGHGIDASAIGCTVTLLCAKAGQWDVMSSAGAWTDL
jgi:hypothetical protein